MKAETPINDFVQSYAESGVSRFHMPGHKGVSLHGLEALDITEIKGAGYLYEAGGVISASEEAASRIFGTARTFYSTEGSSLSIKTMLSIAMRCRGSRSGRTRIIAARNAHKAFIDGCILLDIDPVWIYSKTPSASVCGCRVTPEDVRSALDTAPDAAAVYITSPDYLGNLTDIKGISRICKAYGVPLLVDNAHGAYLKFLSPSLHPIDLGADMCCDSAHKTLPVYTGGSYLHISRSAPEEFSRCAKAEMSLFASTSPSYLIMGSLDKCAGELEGALPERIRKCCRRTELARKRTEACGWETAGDEPMKLTVCPGSRGYSGNELAELMRTSYRIECEYSDFSSVVFMPSPYNDERDFYRLEYAFRNIPKKPALKAETEALPRTETVMSLREACFSVSEEIPADTAEGRICARPAFSCQPSIPLITGGEIFTAAIIKILKNYSIFTVSVVK
ncbi:PLP-dependent transferase [Ruminococcus sp. Marseille-P6503]|uniref:aminotransferase class I/II-fold pyridoxal phosphate-dependent enzyme n=1 Tax=Ruminococcus sp. Marseille-P6503 TaxID=2364796 RepID=UPI000F546139|nr:PLP-dependent transferase [Ruminococcus sp. Marseille-P6503]